MLEDQFGKYLDDSGSPENIGPRMVSHELPTRRHPLLLLGPEKEYYVKGRRAESLGMGIAAFAYYRRVVEHHIHKLVEQIIRVAERTGASAEMLSDLSNAERQTDFLTAVGMVKHGIPSILMLNGHNPLALLRTAIGEGSQEQTDEEYLVLATSIRVVLSDLVDRLGYALKDRAELSAAVARLMKS